MFWYVNTFTKLQKKCDFVTVPLITLFFYIGFIDNIFIVK